MARELSRGRAVPRNAAAGARFALLCSGPAGAYVVSGRAGRYVRRADGDGAWVPGGFPIDLVLFGMIAAFLVLRLRSILGRRQGFERPPEAARPGRPAGRAAEGPVIEGVAEPPGAPPARCPIRPAPLGQALRACSGIDRGFDPPPASWTGRSRRSA